MPFAGGMIAAELASQLAKAGDPCRVKVWRLPRAAAPCTVKVRRRPLAAAPCTVKVWRLPLTASPCTVKVTRLPGNFPGPKSKTRTKQKTLKGCTVQGCTVQAFSGDGDPPVTTKGV